MYAVIQTGGKQYRVQEGDVLRVATLTEKAGKKVSFDNVLMLGEGDAIKVGADVAKASVIGEILEHGLSKKIEIFKKRRRKHSQTTQGHRQAYTAIRITEVGAAKAAAAKPVAEKPAAKPAAEKPAAKAAAKPAAEKPVAKKAAASAEKKPAAKKPAAKKASAKSADKE
ncbi:MAG: 50S ribosomal protein L21 [Mariprofundaceae bacterium]